MFEVMFDKIYKKIYVFLRKYWNVLVMNLKVWYINQILIEKSLKFRFKYSECLLGSCSFVSIKKLFVLIEGSTPLFKCVVKKISFFFRRCYLSIVFSVKYEAWMKKKILKNKRYARVNFSIDPKWTLNFPWKISQFQKHFRNNTLIRNKVDHLKFHPTLISYTFLSYLYDVPQLFESHIFFFINSTVRADNSRSGVFIIF